MRCVVTGGMGFIGSHLAEKLLLNGHHVLVIDNFSTSSIKNLEIFKKYENFKLEVSDISSKRIDSIFYNFKPDYVFHLAAKASVPKSFEEIIDFNDSNITGTLNLLECSKKHKVKRLIFSSSSSVYGGLGPFPQKESSFLQPMSPYALQKKVCEEYCKMYSDYFNLDTVSLRYFNVYGPRQPLRGQYSAVIPIFCSNSFKNKECVVYGDGTQYRDFTFVSDVVNANIKSAFCTKKGLGASFNVCSGKQTSIKKLIEYLNINKIIFCKKRSGDVAASCGDFNKIYEYNGFKTEVSIKNGIDITYKYYSKL